MKARYALIAGVSAFMMSTAANAAHSDYYLKIEGVDGEAKVAEWSFGACNAGQCSTVKSPRDVATGQSTGKRQHKPSVTASQNTQSLRESPTSMHTHNASDASAGAGSDAKAAPPVRSTYDVKKMEGSRLTVAAGDLDGDGNADLAYAGTLDEVSSLSLTFQKIEATWSKVCTGKNIASATLRTGSESYEITNAAVSCTSGGVMGVDDWQQMKLSGGQMKHTRSGHVTLLK